MRNPGNSYPGLCRRRSGKEREGNLTLSAYNGSGTVPSALPIYYTVCVIFVIFTYVILIIPYIILMTILRGNYYSSFSDKKASSEVKCLAKGQVITMIMITISTNYLGPTSHEAHCFF